jgi:hypothetical protein
VRSQSELAGRRKESSFLLITESQTSGTQEVLTILASDRKEFNAVFSVLRNRYEGFCECKNELLMVL